MIVSKISVFRKLYHQLGPGDTLVGNMAFRPGEELKALDLVHRGVKVFPSLLSQFLSRSKALQAEVLGPFMPDSTFVAYRIRDIVQNLPLYAHGGRVVCKRDRKHLGLGISRWNSLEDLLNMAVMDALPYPLVIQPFLRGARDIRVLIIEEYSEAYEKTNPCSFRKNLAHGGKASRIELNSPLEAFCRSIMARGDFPYAVLDVLVDEQNNFFLSEINLTGGLTGSRIGQKEFQSRKKSLLAAFCARPIS